MSQKEKEKEKEKMDVYVPDVKVAVSGLLQLVRHGHRHRSRHLRFGAECSLIDGGHEPRRSFVAGACE
jgi:hypothetical protein